MQARIQDHGLPRHHGIPSDSDDGDREVVVIGELEELEQESERVQHTAIAGDDERPKVQAPVSLERHEDLNVQLEDIIPRHRCEGSDGHVNGLIGCYRLAGQSIARIRPIPGPRVGKVLHVCGGRRWRWQKGALMVECYR